MQVPLPDYEKKFEYSCSAIKKSAKQLVWRNTTLIPPGSKGTLCGRFRKKYNQAAERVMKKRSTHSRFIHT